MKLCWKPIVLSFRIIMYLNRSQLREAAKGAQLSRSDFPAQTAAPSAARCASGAAAYAASAASRAPLRRGTAATPDLLLFPFSSVAVVSNDVFTLHVLCAPAPAAGI